MDPDELCRPAARPPSAGPGRGASRRVPRPPPDRGRSGSIRGSGRLAGPRRRARCRVLRSPAPPPPRSRATARRPRWIRTRTAPSERPITPAISAVVISSTKRRTSARRRSSGRRATAAQAAPASCRRPASDSILEGVGDQGGGLERCRRVAAPAAPDVGNHVAGDLEQPDPERRGAFAVGRPGALLEARQGASTRAGTCVRRRPRHRHGCRARNTRSCTPGRGTSDTAGRRRQGRAGRPRPWLDRGRDG